MSFDGKVHSKIGLIALVIASFVHCGGGGGGNSIIDPPPPPPPAVSVTTGAAPPPRFIPVSASLAVGGTVTWTNGSPVAHDLVATTSNWQLSRTLSPGQSFQATIAQAGTYRYECTIHPGMTGSVEVR
jgi:hypothetical protein